MGRRGRGARRARRAGMHSVTMSEAQLEPTQRLLTELLSMQPAGEAGTRSRFTMAGPDGGTVVDLEADRSGRGLQAGGTVHTSRSEPLTRPPRPAGGNSWLRPGCT